VVAVSWLAFWSAFAGAVLGTATSLTVALISGRMTRTTNLHYEAARQARELRDEASSGRIPVETARDAITALRAPPRRRFDPRPAWEVRRVNAPLEAYLDGLDDAELPAPPDDPDESYPELEAPWNPEEG
jgi:hypothetical protein